MRTANPTGRSSGGRGYVTGVILVAALLSIGAGVWAVATPESFAAYTEFEPYNEHFAHDIGAFLLGIGATLLAALVWHDGKAVALAGFLVGNTVHAANHWVDLQLGGHARDPWVFGALSVAVAMALVLRARQLRDMRGEAAATPVGTQAR
jgi:hypothetical protein